MPCTRSRSLLFFIGRLQVLGALLTLLSCQQDSLTACTAAKSLHTHFSFPTGAAVSGQELQYSADYRFLAAQEFNSVTPENSFKPVYLHPEEGRYEWSEADALVDFCRAHRQRVHGHVLVWHRQLPHWMQEYQGSKAQWEKLLQDHIQTICRHFKGQVTGWDVINEAFEADGTLRNTIWKQHLGSGYLERAFYYAHEADPQALLFYNDYDLESNAVKRRAVLSWVATMRQRGVPIHGLGLQMHISVAHPDNGQLAEAFGEVQRSGLAIHLSEVDVAVNPLGKQHLRLTPELLQRQAAKLAFLVRAYQNIPRPQQYGITFWGIRDSDSWIPSYYNRADYPLLFDDQGKPKPAYCILTER